MDLKLCRLLPFIVVLGIVAACPSIARAVPHCPPLCLLPPDPAPPMPPINVPDPPFNPVAAQNPNSGKGGGTGTAKTAALAHDEEAPKESVTLSSGKVEGGECKAKNVSGTLVMDGGKWTCNFKPSSLKVGGACHANNKIGKVAVVDGQRYCQIAPIAVSDQAKPSDNKKAKAQ